MKTSDFIRRVFDERTRHNLVAMINAALRKKIDDAFKKNPAVDTALFGFNLFLSADQRPRPE